MFKMMVSAEHLKLSIFILWVHFLARCCHHHHRLLHFVSKMVASADLHHVTQWDFKDECLLGDDFGFCDVCVCVCVRVSPGRRLAALSVGFQTYGAFLLSPTPLCRSRNRPAGVKGGDCWPVTEHLSAAGLRCDGGPHTGPILDIRRGYLGWFFFF